MCHPTPSLLSLIQARNSERLIFFKKNHHLSFLEFKNYVVTVILKSLSHTYKQNLLKPKKNGRGQLSRPNFKVKFWVQVGGRTRHHAITPHALRYTNRRGECITHIPTQERSKSIMAVPPMNLAKLRTWALPCKNTWQGVLVSRLKKTLPPPK